MHAPRGLRRVTATVDGRRVRLRRRAIRVRPPAVVRFNVQLSSRALREEDRNVGVGSWDQLREDVLTLREAGVHEVFFDLSFEPTNTNLAATLSFLERFRTILD